MKNVIEINLIDGYKCDSVSNTNDGRNCVELKIICDTTLNPTMTVDGEKIEVTSNDFLYEIPDSILVGSGAIEITMADDNNNGECYIERTTVTGGNLYLRKIDDSHYELQSGLATNEVQEVNYFYYNYSESECLIGNSNLLGQIALPQGAYLLFAKIKVTSSVWEPTAIKHATLGIQYYYDINEIPAIPYETFNISEHIIEGGGSTEGAALYETTGKSCEKINIVVLLDTLDIENSMNGKLANALCTVEIYAVRVGDKFVQAN